jgi:predicted Rossmann fold flavoprotein
MMKKVIVIGGGAAGMAAALAAAGSGASAVILEKNEKLGKKLFITGKGRCNLTNAADMKEVQDHVVSNPRFLFSAFRAFTNADIMRLVEENGCQLKTERGARVFPVSDHSWDVINALERALKKAGVRVRLNTPVKKLLTEPYDSGDEKKGPVSRIKGVLLGGGEVLEADAVILATGGLSYPSTGSDGDGHRFAEETGHRITETFPSLVPMNVKEHAAGELMGLSLRNVEIRILDGGKEKYREFGEMLFTHFGVSGPVILSASAVTGPLLKKKELKLSIDLKPALTEEQLDRRILRDFSGTLNKDLRNALTDLFPARLIPEVLFQAELDPSSKVRDVTKEERGRLVRTAKGLTFTLTGLRGFSEAIVTKGGVSVKDADPSTMQSRRVKGLYFAGELLDLDAMTGGFNLQIAWSTGYLAGKSAAGC